MASLKIHMMPMEGYILDSEAQETFVYKPLAYNPNSININTALYQVAAVLLGLFSVVMVFIYQYLFGDIVNPNEILSLREKLKELLSFNIDAELILES